MNIKQTSKNIFMYIETGAVDVEMDGSVLEEKSSFKMLGLTFSSKLDWGVYIISIAKSASKKLEPWFVYSMKFVTPFNCRFFLNKLRVCFNLFMLFL